MQNLPLTVQENAKKLYDEKFEEFLSSDPNTLISLQKSTLKGNKGLQLLLLPANIQTYWR